MRAFPPETLVDFGYKTGAQGLAKDKPFIFFVHGAGGSALSWQGVLSPLSHRFNAVAVDLPGHGQTPGPASDTIIGYATWLYQALREFTPGRFLLAGHSMGGAIALTYALTYPEDLLGLILVGSGARLRVSPQILEGLGRDFPATISLIVDWCFHQNNELLKEASREMMAAAGPEVLQADFLACDRFDLMGRLGAIACPVLAIAGRQDRMTPPKFAEYLASQIAQAELKIIEDAGHMVQAEKPKEFIAAIADFAGRLTNSPIAG